MEPLTATESPLASLITDIALVQWFDDHWYKVTFLNGRQRSYVSASTYTGGVFALDWLPRYRGRIGNDQADQEMALAGHQGTQVHHAIHVMCKPGFVAFDHPLEANVEPEHRKKVNSMIAQCKERDIPFYLVRDQYHALLIDRYVQLHLKLGGKVEASEMIVYSAIYETAGALDQIRSIEAGPKVAEDGNLIVNIPSTGKWILDFKTGNEDESHKLQVSVYAVCYEESKNEKVEGAIVVYLNGKVKKGIPGVKCVVRTRQELMDEDFPDAMRAKALWHRAHPNAEPKVAEFKAFMWLPDIVEEVPNGFILPNPIAEAKAAEEELAELNADPPQPSAGPSSVQEQAPPEAPAQETAPAPEVPPPSASEELSLDGDVTKRYAGKRKKV